MRNVNRKLTAALFARCLDEVQTGRMTVEECAGQYGEFSEDLARLLEIALAIPSARDIQPSSEFRSSLRQRLAAQGRTEALDAS